MQTRTSLPEISPQKLKQKLDENNSVFLLDVREQNKYDDDIPESIANQATSIQSLACLDALFDQVWDAKTLNEIDLRNDNK